ncbi:MAG: hypothetical protein P4L77_08075 [Sulfuriferula sp.]|nr:hypothetical protein [Sulfuriferula sp.]
MRKSILFATLLAATLGSGTAAFAQGGGHGGANMGGMGMSAQHSWHIQQQHHIQTQARHQYGRPVTSGNQLHYQIQSRDQYQTRIMAR